MTQQFAKTALKLFFFGLLFVASLEAALWCYLSWYRAQPRLLEYHEKLGWANRRSFNSLRHRRDGKSWAIQIDESGRRTTAPRAANPSRSLLVLGDSFAFGDSIDSQNHFASHLTVKHQIAVENLGVVGYATDQQFLALEDYRGSADVLLVMSYLSNDLRDNLTLFEKGGLRFKPKLAFESGAPSLRYSQHRWLNRLRNNSYLTTFTLGLLFSKAPYLEMFDPVPEGNFTELAKRRYLEILALIFQEAKKKEISQTLVVVWSELSSGAANVQAEEIRDFIEQQGARLINFDQILSARLSSTEEAYFSSETDPGLHWNKKGHQIFAETLVDALKEKATGEPGRTSAPPA